MRPAAVLLSLSLTACTQITGQPRWSEPSLGPVELRLGVVPRPIDEKVARDATLYLTFDGYPDPDTIRFGTVLVRSGTSNFDARLGIDFVGRALTVQASNLFVAQNAYEVVLAPEIALLDGRTLGRTATFQFDVGDGRRAAPPPPPIAWAEVRALLAGCTGCHGPADEDGRPRPPARGLDLAGDPRDGARGLINVPAYGLRGALRPLLRVAPGDPARSVLLRKLIGGDRHAATADPPYPDMRVDGRRMPLEPDGSAGEPFDEAALRTVERWIAEGASVD